MSTDLEIDLFARDLFDALWRQHGLRTEPLKSKLPPTKSAFNENILRGVEARQAIFHYTYEEIFENSHKDFLGHSGHFFSTIAERFPHYPRDDLSDDMKMNLFLCSCAFVADMVMWCKSKGDDFLDVADKAWAMFADMYLKEAFYEAGGWNDLQVFAEADLAVYDYVRNFSNMVHCNLGKNVLLHRVHLTIGAIESFLSFEAWPGVNDNDPMVLEWVDYCVLEPKRRIRPARFFRQAIPKVFKELESTIDELGLICNPYYPDEDSDATESVMCSPNVGNIDRESCHSNFDNTFRSPITPTSHLDTDRGRVDEYVSGSKAVKLRASDPEKIAQTFETPVYVVRLSGDDNTSKIDGEYENSGSQSSTTEKGNKEESLGETDKEKIKSQISDLEEEDTVVKKLRSSSEGQTNLKVSMETEDESIPYNKNVQPINSDSLESRMETDSAIKEILSIFSSHGISATILNPAEFSAENDGDESNMNTNPSDLDDIMEKLGLKKMSDYSCPDSKSRLRYYVNTNDSNNIANTNGSPEEISKPRSSTPPKSPLTSTNMNQSVSSITDDGTLHKRKNNSSGSDGRRRVKRSTGTENFLLSALKDQEDKHSDCNSLFFKNVSCLKNKTDSSKQDKDKFLPDNDDDELENLAKYSVKTYGRTKKFKPENKPNDRIYENSIPDYRKPPDYTIESSQIDQCVKDVAIPIPFEYLSGTPTPEGLNFPRNKLKDMVDEGSSSNPEMLTPRCLDVQYQDSILTNNDEKDLILEKSLTVFKPVEMNDLSEPPNGKESDRSNRRISQNSSSTEIYEITGGENSSAEPTLGNPFIFASGGKAEGTKNNADITPDCYKLFDSENEMTSAETIDENPFRFDGEKSKQEVNSNDPNLEALQASQSESTTAESVLENPFEFSSEPPQDVEKKGKKKRPRKRLTRLEQRVKEEGNGIRDVMRLMLVMGHKPSMAYFASTLQDAKKQNSEDAKKQNSEDAEKQNSEDDEKQNSEDAEKQNSEDESNEK